MFVLKKEFQKKKEKEKRKRKLWEEKWCRMSEFLSAKKKLDLSLKSCVH